VFISLIFISPASDSIFLLSGVVDVVLFCTIPRVIPVKEFAKALFTGQIFRTHQKSPGDTTWCIGTLESGERCISDHELSIPANDDHFVLRQPKFEIVTPPPVLLPNEVVLPTALRQTARLSLAVSGEIVVHPVLRSPPPRTTGSIPRKPLPREYHIHSEDAESNGHSPAPCQGSTRRTPSISQGPRTPTLPLLLKNGGFCLIITAHSQILPGRPQPRNLSRFIAIQGPFTL
jgi:hypothetical protein